MFISSDRYDIHLPDLLIIIEVNKISTFIKSEMLNLLSLFFKTNFNVYNKSPSISRVLYINW